MPAREQAPAQRLLRGRRFSERSSKPGSCFCGVTAAVLKAAARCTLHSCVQCSRDFLEYAKVVLYVKGFRLYQGGASVERGSVSSCHCTTASSPIGAWQRISWVSRTCAWRCWSRAYFPPPPLLGLDFTIQHVLTIVSTPAQEGGGGGKIHNQILGGATRPPLTRFAERFLHRACARRQKRPKC